MTLEIYMFDVTLIPPRVTFKLVTFLQAFVKLHV